MTMEDILLMPGYVIGSYFLGYGLSYIMYVIRRTAWLATS